MAHDQHLLRTTKGKKSSKNHLDPGSILYDSIDTAALRGSQGKLRERIKSAAPRLGENFQKAKTGNSPARSLVGTNYSTVRDPWPTPVTSRPLSSKSSRSSVNSRLLHKTGPISLDSSPTALYLGSRTARCKSAPPRSLAFCYPGRPKTGTSRKGSATLDSRSAPRRAWQNRTSSAKSQHSLLSREEVDRRHNERCKSAPPHYDFSSIEIVCSVPEQGSDIQRLKAFTRPLNCMPDVVQNVLSHNGLRHCCSAYQQRPKSACSSRQHFWPVTRPAVFHRGDVPKYLHFVKPSSYWIKGAQSYPRIVADNESMMDDHSGDLEEDREEIVFYQEQFLVPATPSEASLSDRDELQDADDLQVQSQLDLDLSEEKDLTCTDGKDGEPVINDHEVPVVISKEGPDEVQNDDQDPELSVINQGIEVIISTVEQLPRQNLYPEEVQQESDTFDNGLQDLVSEIPQWAAQEVCQEEEWHSDAEPLKEDAVQEKDEGPLGDVKFNNQEPIEADVVAQADHELSDPVVPVVPVAEVKDELPQEASVKKENTVREVKPLVNEVKFADSLILTSYKPQMKKEKKDQPVKPVSILKPTVAKKEEEISVPAPLTNIAPVVEHKVSTDLPKLKPLLKPVLNQSVKKSETKDKEEKPADKMQEREERTEQPPKVEPTTLPKPEYIRAPGAYRMYDPKDLLSHHMEQRQEMRRVKKSLSTSAMPQFKPSAESTEVMATVLEESKRRKEGMKPWLQGRLALSKQTSRFELPMDVRLLEEMTPMEYLTKYCIISTRRKALYKHIFQKVDKDRDNAITVKEMDRGLREIHVDCITTDQVRKLIEMVEGNEKSKFNLVQFSAIAAFSERLLFSETQISEKNSVYSSKEVIEEADFCGLKYKLTGFSVNPTVRKILEVL